MANPLGPRLEIAELRAAYLSDAITPETVLDTVLERAATPGYGAVWIERVDTHALRARAAFLADQDPQELPLYGIPFAIKDNIDASGLPTSAACPAFTYTPDSTATVVQRLLDSGAILVGKTNLDQFATGLVGIRSPHGPVPNAIDPDYVSGGSSSGSAVAVALGACAFALGTDTAGSGRIPAGFNGLVGLKPTRGLLSTQGVVPACRSLDCVSIFANTIDDANAVLAVAAAEDPQDPFSRTRPQASVDRPITRLGVPAPAQRAFFGDPHYPALYEAACQSLARTGFEVVEIDFAPFLEVARLLYDGPWIAERYHAVRDLIERDPDALHPVTRAVIEKGLAPSAVDTFDAYYRLKSLRRRVAPLWDEIDAVVVPTAGTIYTIAAVEADPIQTNTNLGYYTNAVNLLDQAALAVPAGTDARGLPFGVTFIGPPFSDSALAAAAQRWIGTTTTPQPSSPAATSEIRLAVCGAHMTDLPLNHELTRLGARLESPRRTAPRYRLFALPGSPPTRPGMLRGNDGAAIELEVWRMPCERLGQFLAGIPAPLGLGKVELDDGDEVVGFLCEAYATAQAQDITAYGGWRRYVAEASPSPTMEPLPERQAGN